MIETTLHWAAIAGLVFIFVFRSGKELYGWRAANAQFMGLGFPHGTSAAVPALKIVGGLMLLHPATLEIGLGICLFVVAAGVATIVYRQVRQAYPMVFPPAIIICVLAAITWFTR